MGRSLPWAHGGWWWWWWWWWGGGLLSSIPRGPPPRWLYMRHGAAHPALGPGALGPAGCWSGTTRVLLSPQSSATQKTRVAVVCCLLCFCFFAACACRLPQPSALWLFAVRRSSPNTSPSPTAALPLPLPLLAHHHVPPRTTTAATATATTSYYHTEHGAPSPQPLGLNHKKQNKNGPTQTQGPSLFQQPAAHQMSHQEVQACSSRPMAYFTMRAAPPWRHCAAATADPGTMPGIAHGGSGQALITPIIAAK
jgi:hypothetical protein